MMAKTKRDGDIIWVFWRGLSGQTLIGRRDLQPWIDALIDGVGPDGIPVKKVNFVFGDRDCASYNFDNLSFARVGVFLDGDPPTAFESKSGTPSFSVREDSGIPPES
jgi:hypothetical protein